MTHFKIRLGIDPNIQRDIKKAFGRTFKERGEVWLYSSPWDVNADSHWTYLWDELVGHYRDICNEPGEDE